MRRFLRENGLTLFFGAIFLAALAGQGVAGYLDHNQQALVHGENTITLGRYLTSSAFGQAVMENWQSEYLQFTLFILVTVWLLQRGSPESKELDQAGQESDQKQKIGPHARADSPLWARVGGARTWIYSNSLVMAMILIFLGAWFAQSVTGWTDYNEDLRSHGESVVAWIDYLGSARFWESTLQNWQSEFLAVGSLAVFTIYLRQRGSPESKPVGAPSEGATGSQG